MSAIELPLEAAARGLRTLGGEDAQVVVLDEASLLSRFARSAPTQATAVADRTAHVLVVQDGHTGRAQTNDLSDDGLAAAARRAVAAARAVRETASGPGEHPGLPQTGEADRAAADADDALLDPAAAGAALQVAFDRCAEGGLEAFGAWTAGRLRTGLASSAGLRLDDELTDTYLKVIARHPDTARTGWATTAGTGLADLDADATARRAAGKVGAGTPEALAPGAYDVVLEADAVGELVGFLGDLAFGGRAHAEGTGALAGRLGEQVAAPGVTLLDAPGGPGQLQAAFDAEGTAKAPLTLIEDGVAQAVCHDRRSAALAGTASTGHAAWPGGFWEDSPRPRHLALQGGDAPDEAALYAGIERGIYVTRVWYVNVVHARSTLVTGTSRDGTFLIEDGRLTRPLRDVRFTDSLLRLLKATDALTSARKLAAEGVYYGSRRAVGTVAPALRARGFVVSGQTTA